MSSQLSLFDEEQSSSHAKSMDKAKLCAGDKKAPSPATLGDAKKQAIQRYLERTKPETSCSVEKYSPNGRKTEYFRLKFRQGRKTNTVHIKGGNISARLANYRANRLQGMIERGAELTEVLEQLADFNEGTSNK